MSTDRSAPETALSAVKGVSKPGANPAATTGGSLATWNLMLFTVGVDNVKIEWSTGRG